MKNAKRIQIKKGVDIIWDSPKIDKSKNGYDKDWTKERCLSPNYSVFYLVFVSNSFNSIPRLLRK